MRRVWCYGNSYYRLFWPSNYSQTLLCTPLTLILYGDPEDQLYSRLLSPREGLIAVLSYRGDEREFLEDSAR